MKIFTTLVLSSILASSAFAEYDSSKADAHYKKLANINLQLAQLGAQSKANGLYCDDGTYESEITTAAVKAITSARYVNDGKRTAAQVINTIKEDKKLQNIISTKFSYRLSLALSVLDHNAAERAALIGSTMYGPAMGAYGNTKIIRFLTANLVEISTMNMDIADDGNISWDKKVVPYTTTINKYGTPTYTIEGKKYQMSYYNSGGEAVLGPVPPNPDNMDDYNPYLEGFAEFPSECEA